MQQNTEHVHEKEGVNDQSMTEEDRSKDAFFAEIGDVAQRMIDKHGKDFAMGVLIIGARFIAEGKPLVRPN